MAEAARKLAVLIDADNTSPKIADGLFEEVAKIGEASLRRIYGDFSKGQHGRLGEGARRATRSCAQQQFAYTTGKNSTDITLVIDAMDLLHSGRFDGFCLVSSDSDFTRLAARIREQGVDVYGIGQAKTPESFRQACTRFIFTENFAADADSPGTAKAALRPMSEAVELIGKALEQLEDDAEGWFQLGTVGQRLTNLSPEFDTRTFGHAKLSDLVEATGRFEINRTGQHVRLRPKPGARGRKRRLERAGAACGLMPLRPCGGLAERRARLPFLPVYAVSANVARAPATRAVAAAIRFDEAPPGRRRVSPLRRPVLGTDRRPARRRSR